MKRRDFYRGATAKRYEQQRQGSLWGLEQRAVESMGMGSGESVLDVPVGTGRFLPIYAAKGMYATGVDVSPDMLAEARKKGTDAALQVGDIFDLPFPDDAFDWTVCFRLLNWMDLPEVEKALREMARATSGTLHVSVTVLIGPPRANVARIIHDPDAWEEAVAKAGLDVLETNVLREHNSHCYQVVTLA